MAGTGSEFLHASGKALTSKTIIPSLEPVNTALIVYHDEIAALRAEGRTLKFSIDSVEGLFALGFALDQLSQNLRELRQRIKEITRKPD
jgi:prefoldin subunit 5